MSLNRCLLALAALPLALGGCGVLGLSTPGASPSATPAPPGTGWLVLTQGSATPSPGPSAGGYGRAGAAPKASFRPTPTACAQWDRLDAVVIPLRVTPGKGSLTITWPQMFGSDYRVAAVPQPLVSGSQPAEVWHPVPASTGC